MNDLRLEIQNILSSGVSTALYSGFALGSLGTVSLTGSAIPTMASLSLAATDIDITGASTAATQTKISTTISNLGSAVDRLVLDQESIGSWIHRLEFEKAQAEVESVNLEDSLSTIADADLAEEQMALTRYQILQQTALAMLAQFNTAPFAILSLFSV